MGASQVETPPFLSSLQSIPIGLELYPAMHTYETLIDMFNNAVTSIDIAAFYFTLTDGAFKLAPLLALLGASHVACPVWCRVPALERPDENACTLMYDRSGTPKHCGQQPAHPPPPSGTVEEGAQPGIDVYNAILAAAKRGVAIRVAVVR